MKAHQSSSRFIELVITFLKCSTPLINCLPYGVEWPSINYMIGAFALENENTQLKLEISMEEIYIIFNGIFWPREVLVVVVHYLDNIHV